MTIDYQAMSDQVMLSMLCQGFTGPVGPFGWLCRLAWFCHSEGVSFDPEAAIREHADWLNQPVHAQSRRNVIDCMNYIREIAERTAPLFDCESWMTRP